MQRTVVITPVELGDAVNKPATEYSYLIRALDPTSPAPPLSIHLLTPP